MQLVILLLIVLAVGAVGAVAGWFLNLGMIIMLSTVSGVNILFLSASMRRNPGTSAGMGPGMLRVLVLIFLIAMWLAYAIASGWFDHATAVDWAWIKRLFLR